MFSWGPSGLVPAVVQDVATAGCWMVAYVDSEALAPHSRRRVHFTRGHATASGVRARPRQRSASRRHRCRLRRGRVAIPGRPVGRPATAEPKLLRRGGCGTSAVGSAQPDPRPGHGRGARFPGQASPGWRRCGDHRPRAGADRRLIHARLLAAAWSACAQRSPKRPPKSSWRQG